MEAVVIASRAHDTKASTAVLPHKMAGHPTLVVVRLHLKTILILEGTPLDKLVGVMANTTMDTASLLNNPLETRLHHLSEV